MKKILLAVMIISWLNFANATGAHAHNKHNGHHHKVKKNKLIKKYPKKITKSRKKFDYMNGIASYYGGTDGFDNCQMANGDIFDSNNPNLSAHPTLPLGTKLKVTNLANGRSVYVEVADRMPKHGRVIDLSKSAAKRLGMLHHGISRVHLKVISDEEFYQNTNTIELNEGDSYR